MDEGDRDDAAMNAAPESALEATDPIVIDDVDGLTESPRWYGRLPWKNIAIALGLAVFWLAIGLVCSPRYFRF